jgi:glycosyltransferase involved in cell wall biosynthesis
LPIVTTTGDVLSKLVSEQNLGRVVADGDVDGWVGAIEELLDDPREYETAKRNIAQVRPEYEWPNAVNPLVEAALAAGEIRPRSRRSAGMVVRYVWLSAVGAVIKRGFRAALSRAVQMVRKPRVP